MKTITFRISDVVAAMLNELQLRNQLPRDLAKMFAANMPMMIADYKVRIICKTFNRLYPDFG